jgi:hypothetical protein
VQQVLEILFYDANDFDSKKFKKSLGWYGFIGLEVLWQNGQN